MARYSHEFMGIRGDPRDTRGMDPNYRGGYRGMRMHGYDDQAAYGWHRWTHDEDFEGSGGYMGRSNPPERAMYEGGYRRPRGAYDRGWGGGGARDPRFVRDFNANSPVVRYGGDYDRPRYGEEFRRRNAPQPRPGHFQGERFDYANRGINSGGHSEGWAWGPMRGSR